MYNHTILKSLKVQKTISELDKVPFIMDFLCCQLTPLLPS